MTWSAIDLMRRKASPRGGRDGFIVVAVLWMLGALATLASIYAVYVINTATAMGVNDDRLQAEGLMTAPSGGFVPAGSSGGSGVSVFTFRRTR